MPAKAAAGTAASSSSADGGVATGTSPQSQQEIVVIAPPLFRDIQPERSLDQDAIDSYGASTIDEILNDIEVELGEDAEQPLLIVNGQRINDISEIGALPVEALRSIQVLPRGSALRAGGTSNQRVISITLKPFLRSETLTAGHKISTDGSWNADRGEAMVTAVKGETRANLSFRARDDAALLESQRGVIQPPLFVPYASAGNIVGYPNTIGEIDPLLSALAGENVTVVPLPVTATPTLADLAAVANQQNTTDLGHFRTLRPDSRGYDANGTFATRLSPWLTMNSTLRWNRSTSHSIRGLPTGLFILYPDNPFSPFSTPVALALYGPKPLRTVATQKGRGGNATFDATWGSWEGNLNLQHDESQSRFVTGREAVFGAVPIPDGTNPFSTDLANQIMVRTDSSSTRARQSVADLTLNGPLATLPAGSVLAVVEAMLQSDHLRSGSTFAGLGDVSFRRNQQSIRAALEVPLTSRSTRLGSAVGDLSASVEYARAHYSDAGFANHTIYALTWEPRPLLRIHASIDRTHLPAPIQTLGNPVIITSAVRIFDPLTGETVDVTQIGGGNPSLTPQSTKIRDVSALFRLVPKLSLQLNAEYTDAETRNFVSSLPEASAAVMLAFPDRFIRDSNGNLTTVDLRPVNFDSQREKRFRWGLSMNAKIAGGQIVQKTIGSGANAHNARITNPTTFLQFTANHTIVFSNEVVIRPGLPHLDLLNGGAIGFANGRPRHQLDATAAITSRGLGLRTGLTWRGESELQSRVGGVTDTLRFSPLFLLNLRGFADVRRLLPQARWAKGFRVSLDVINLTNGRQKVRDSLGNTPLQYQPAYRDPLGRTVEIEVRKVF